MLVWTAPDVQPVALLENLVRWNFFRTNTEPLPKPAQQKQPQPAVNGFYRCREKLISGWLIDLTDSRHKHDVEVFVGGESIGIARCDRFDPLVHSHHGGDGNYAFALYYDGEFMGAPIQTRVIDCESGTPLGSKLPLINPSPRSGPPFAVDAIHVGRSVELIGRVGDYPWIDASLELWSRGQRVVSAIPIIGSESAGTFSATLEGGALEHLFRGGVEIALPGLKEAGLAVPLHKAPVLVAMSPADNNRLRVELRGKFEQSGPIEAVMRFINGDRAVEEPLSMSSKVAIVRMPAGFKIGEGTFELAIRDIPIPARLEWPLLNDMQFRHLGEESSQWSISENATAESGFFAFPMALAEEHELSGYTAHLDRQTGEGPLILFQPNLELTAKQQEVSLTVFARAAPHATLVARLRDEEGVQSECSVTTGSSETWNLLRLHLHSDQPVAGKLVLEVEASGPDVAELDVTLGRSRQLRQAGAGDAGPNLLANDGLDDWPDGAGVLKHSGAGRPCGGWHLVNRRCSEFVFTRAITHPSDGALGLALAAPHIKHYLRLEAEVAANDLAERPLLLRFRAGMPPAAKQLLANETEGLPQFTIADPIQLIRRVRITTASGLEERESIVGVFARKVPISQALERFEFSLPPLEGTTDECPEDAQDIQETYHIALEFRQPAVIALFDVELLAKEPADVEQMSPLKVEDRNVELQLDSLKTAVHWKGPTPVRLADKPTAANERLKWGVGALREPVTVVVPVFNALSETLACLDSLNGTTTVPILVSVVDDASDPPVREALLEYSRDKPWLRVQSFRRNRGYTYAADHGIRDARTDWVVLLNSDTIVTRGWLDGMLACAQSHPDIAFVGPVSNAASYQSVPELYDASHKWKINALPPGATPEDIAEIVRRVSLKDYPEVPLLNGFCALINRSVFIELGGLNSAAFPAGYGEENDLCLRANKAGVKLAVADDIYVYHVKSASFGDTRRKELSKAGDAALKKLHPDVDVGALTARLRETPALVSLRRSVAAEIEKLHALPQIDEQVTAKPKMQRKKSASDKRKPKLQKA